MSLSLDLDMCGIPAEKRIDIKNIMSYTVLQFFDYFLNLKNSLKCNKKYYYNDVDYYIMIKKYKVKHSIYNSLQKEFYILHLKDISADWEGFIRCNFNFFNSKENEAVKEFIIISSCDKKIIKILKI